MHLSLGEFKSLNNNFYLLKLLLLRSKKMLKFPVNRDLFGEIDSF